MPRRHDRPADAQWHHALVTERGDELRRRRIGEILLLAFGGSIEHGPVLRDDPIEDVRCGKHGENVRKGSSGHENQPAARLTQTPQGIDRRRVDVPRERQRAVIVASEREIAHGNERIYRRAGLRYDHRPRLVKKVFTLCPNDRAPSLTCSHALFASGSAALPASFIRSPVVLAPSTTVLPTPLAVS